MSPYLLAARPKTLPAAVAPVLLASALAWRDGVFASFPAGVALAFALLIQVGTNYANDYFDFVKGADTPERVGPTRAVAAGLVTPRAMLRATAITFGLALAVGLLLVPAGGTWIILVGLLCVLMGLAYTGGPYPLAYNGLADVFVLLFFGIVAVTMTYYVQAGTITSAAFVLSFAPGALATNILCVNNFRDYETDRAASKRTLIVRYGRGMGAIEYVVNLMIAQIAPALLCVMGYGLWTLLPLLAFPVGRAMLVRMLNADTRQAHDRALAGTAVYLLIHSLLLAAGLALG